MTNEIEICSVFDVLICSGRLIPCVWYLAEHDMIDAGVGHKYCIDKSHWPDKKRLIRLHWALTLPCTDQPFSWVDGAAHTVIGRQYMMSCNPVSASWMFHHHHIQSSFHACFVFISSDAPLDLKIKSNMVSDLLSLVGEFPQKKCSPQ